MSRLNKATPVDPQRELVEAADILLEARLIGEFVNSIGRGPVGHVIDLNEEQTSGFYVVMRYMLDQIEKSEALMEKAIDSLNGSREGES